MKEGAEPKTTSAFCRGRGVRRALVSCGVTLCLAFSGCMGQGHPAVTVAAGSHDLESAPVAVEVSPDVWDVGTSLCLESGGLKTPGQTEMRSDGRMFLWLMAEIPAGETRDYRINRNEDCGGMEYRWVEAGERRSTLMAGGSPVLDYLYPRYDPENIEETHKPFHHVYAPSRDYFITKGFGGLYPHHKGIFYGYNRIDVSGRTYDVWHAHDGERTEHHRVDKMWPGPVYGGHAVTIHWRGRDGEPFIEETRLVRVFSLPGGEALIDVESTLRSLAGTITLGGDLHHAGMQFRASQDVEQYVDLSWNALQFVVEGDPYTVGYFSHPSNPPGGQMSERLYGRFGEYVPSGIDEEHPLTLRYRFFIAAGHDVTREDLDAVSVQYRIPE